MSEDRRPACRAPWLALLVCVLACVLVSVRTTPADPPAVKQDVQVSRDPAYGVVWDPTRTASAADGRRMIRLWEEMRDLQRETRDLTRAMAAKMGAAPAAVTELAGDAVLVKHCASCHGEAKRGGFQMFAGGRLLAPRDGEWESVWREIDSDNMPKDPNAKLTPAEKAAVKKLIDRMVAPKE